MIQGFFFLCSLLPKTATSSQGGLAQVQSGWGAFRRGWPMEYVWIFVGGLGLIILSALVFYLLRRRKVGSLKNWSSITEPYRISAALSRAEARNANFSLEIFNPDHHNLYRGRLDRLDEGRGIYLALNEAPPPDLRFENEACQVHLNFRPSMKQPMEHYQFATYIQALDFTREKGWRTARLIVGWPKSLIQAQKRNYLRLAPPLGKDLGCEIYAYQFGDLKDFGDSLGRAAVLDIGMGGAHLIFEGPFASAPGQLFIASLALSALELELPSNIGERLELLVPVEILSLDKVAPPSAHTPEQMNTVIRVKFLGRYFKSRVDDVLIYRHRNFRAMDFQDLAYWLQACYRLELQKERGLVPPSSFDRPSNRFPSTPPQRPPSKYD